MNEKKLSKTKRHELEFPMDENLYPILPKMWKDGWFDEFSEQHFLIRALQKDKGIWNNMERYHRVYQGIDSVTRNTFPVTFCINFSAKMNLLVDVFGEKEIKKFVCDQLSAGKKHYNESQFFEALSEIEILVFFCQFGPGRAEGKYEPKIGKGKHNPEASLMYPEGERIDIEVKTPEFSYIHKRQSLFMPLYSLTSEGIDKFEKICKKRGLLFQRPRISKLKSFLDSACEKFIEPVNENHYNILFINWTYTEIPNRGFIEPCTILYNQYNGIFNHYGMAEKVGINNEIYKKITAIFIFQNPFEAIAFQDLRYLFATRQAVLLLNPFILDSEEKKDNFYQTIQIRKNDFVLNEMPNLYYDIEKYSYLYCSAELQKVINEYKIEP